MPSFVWTVPTRADGRRRAPGRWNRGDWEPANATRFADSIRDVRDGAFTSFDHLLQVVRAADASGFDGISIPYDPDGEEAWVVAAAALRASRYLEVIPEFPAGFATPVYAAKMSTTLQRGSAGRLGWQLAVEVDPAVAGRQGDLLTGDDRYRRAEEFVTAARAVYAGPGVHLDGRFYQVDAGGFGVPLAGDAFPRVYTSGSGDAALAFAAAHADAHVLAGDARAVLAERIGALRRLAGDRPVQVAVSLPVLAREHRDEALAKAQRLLDRAGDPSAAGDFVTAGGGWVGFDRIGLSQRYGLLGSFAEVAARLGALADIGVDTFVLDTPGRLEGAYLLGENLLPLFTDSLTTPKVEVHA